VEDQEEVEGLMVRATERWMLMERGKDSPESLGGAGTREFCPAWIRRAEPADLGAMARIESRSFSNPWHPRTFRSLITQERTIVLVADVPDDGVVGYAVSWWVLDQAELGNIAVREDRRGRGIGSALLDRVLDEIRERGVESVFLEVRMSNARAHALYRARGFIQIAVRADYYRNPAEDARVLVKDLQNICSQFRIIR